MRKHYWLMPLMLMTGIAFSSASRADFTRIEQDHVSVSYEGTWTTVSAPGVSGGTGKVANAAGARVNVLFRGTGISWIGYRCSCTWGTAWVYVDGERKVLTQAIPSSSSVPEAQSPIYTITGLGTGSHLLTIELTGTSVSGDTANTYIAIDAFDIENGAPMRRLEENNAAVSTTGAWVDMDDRSVSAGSVIATQESGATATLRFNGNSLEWISYGCPCTGGIANLSIDGQSFGPQSSNSSVQLPQLKSFSTVTLPDGQHELNLRVTGANVGTPPWFVIDAFQVDATGSDTDAPQVTMTAPANDAQITGLVTLEAAATDNVGVTKVQFWAQRSGGSYVLLGEDTAAPYTLTGDTSRIGTGQSFRLRARAWDAANNYAESPVVNVTIRHTADQTPPDVTITTPAAGSTVSGVINLTATATDNDAVTSVRFIIDFLSYDYIMTVPIEQPPYTMSVDTRNLKDGSHKLSASAFDYAGNSDVSEIMVTVDNSVQPGRLRVDDDHPALIYNGTWALESDGEFPRFHWDSAAWSATPGATVTGTFQGTGVIWHGFRCPDCGVATISIDGGAPQQVDTYDPDRPGQGIKLGSPAYISPTLASGTHTLTLTVQPSTRPGATRVYVDAFEVLQ
jgi:hypothetical protein